MRSGMQGSKWKALKRRSMSLNVKVSSGGGANANIYCVCTCQINVTYRRKDKTTMGKKTRKGTADQTVSMIKNPSLTLQCTQTNKIYF